MLPLDLSSWIEWRVDWLVLVALSIGSFALARRVVRRLGGKRRLGAAHFAVLAGLAALAFASAELVGRRERSRLRATVQNLAPTYAQELQRLGHWQIGFDVKPEDPTYCSLLDAERRWCDANPTVADIYTLRLGPGGELAYVVDAETDFDGDGRFERAGEARRPVGDASESSGLELVRALCGVSTFLEQPVAGPRGPCFTAFEPLRDPTGRVEGVLGVDFGAHEWLRSEALSRGGTLALLFLAYFVYLAATSSTLVMRGEIDRRRDVERELRASEERLRAILDHDPDFVGLIGPDGAILEVNPAGLRLLGVASKQEVLGRSLEAALSPLQPERLRSLHLTTASSAPMSVEYQIQTRIGDPRWVHSHSVPLGPRFGFSRTFLVVTRDIHERKIAEQEAERLQKELLDASRTAGMAEIATGILHNIGNVINTANIAASSLGSRVDELRVESVAKVAKLLQEHESDLGAFFGADPRAQRLPALVGEIARALEEQRDVIRAENETLEHALDHVKGVIHAQQALARKTTVYDRVDPRDICEDALRLNAESIERHGIQVERSYAQSIPLLLDRHKVLQILINLLSNAKSAVGACPVPQRRIQVALSSHCVSGVVLVRFEVRDWGVGIPKENLTRIFTHGFSTRDGGHGFGLHTSALAAKEMGGSLTVQSLGTGHGATFALQVPARSQVETAAA